MDFKHLIQVSLLVKKQDKHPRLNATDLCTYIDLPISQGHMKQRYLWGMIKCCRNQNPIEICKENNYLSYFVSPSFFQICLEKRRSRGREFVYCHHSQHYGYFCSCWDSSNSYIMTWMCLPLWKCDSKTYPAVKSSCFVISKCQMPILPFCPCDGHTHTEIPSQVATSYRLIYWPGNELDNYLVILDYRLKRISVPASLLQSQPWHWIMHNSCFQHFENI